MNIDYIRSLINLVEESGIEELEKEINILGLISINKIRIRKYLKEQQAHYQQVKKMEQPEADLAKIVKGEAEHDEYHRHSLYSEHVHKKSSEEATEDAH